LFQQRNPSKQFSMAVGWVPAPIIAVSKPLLWKQLLMITGAQAYKRNHQPPENKKVFAASAVENPFLLPLDFILKF